MCVVIIIHIPDFVVFAVTKWVFAQSNHILSNRISWQLEGNISHQIPVLVLSVMIVHQLPLTHKYDYWYLHDSLWFVWSAMMRIFVSGTAAVCIRHWQKSVWVGVSGSWNGTQTQHCNNICYVRVCTTDSLLSMFTIKRTMVVIRCKHLLMVWMTVSLWYRHHPIITHQYAMNYCYYLLLSKQSENSNGSVCYY